MSEDRCPEYLGYSLPLLDSQERAWKVVLAIVTAVQQGLSKGQAMTFTRMMFQWLTADRMISLLLWGLTGLDLYSQSSQPTIGEA